MSRSTLPQKPSLPIAYGQQSLSEADAAAVAEVLHSGRITQGPAVEQFEQDLAQYCGVEHVVAVSSGTSALHLACLALGAGQGDWVWTSAMTFSASAMAAKYCGARVDFLDISSSTINIDVVRLEQRLERAQAEDRLPKILVVVHFAGLSCDMQEISRLAAHYGFKIVEDACHALGAHYRARPVGCCQYSDATVFSFHPIKSITTGEGGAVCCSDPVLAGKLRKLRHHNIQQPKSDDMPWAYDIPAPGFNYRMTDLQAALGSSQLGRLDDFVAKRREIAAYYRRELAALPLAFQEGAEIENSALHLFIIRVAAQQRQSLYFGLHQAQILVQVHYPPLYRLSVFSGPDMQPDEFPGTEQYYQSCLSLPIHPELRPNQLNYIAETLSQLLDAGELTGRRAACGG